MPSPHGFVVELNSARSTLTEVDPKSARLKCALNSVQRTIGLSKRLTVLVDILLDAYDFAQELDVGPEQFAVEWPVLSRFAITPNDVRWLHAKHFVLHLVEHVHTDGSERRFEQRTPLAFQANSCFQLTELGVHTVRALNAHLLEHPVPPPPPAPFAQCCPYWDADRRELRWGESLIKRFKIAAPNQEIILCSFQEEGWPPHLDDPLPPVHDVEPKRRLHDTIVSLNRHHEQPGLRFTGDGTGRGVRWECSPTS